MTGSTRMVNDLMIYFTTYHMYIQKSGRRECGIPGGVKPATGGQVRSFVICLTFRFLEECLLGGRGRRRRRSSFGLLLLCQYTATQDTHSGYQIRTHVI